MYTEMRNTAADGGPLTCRPEPSLTGALPARLARRACVCAREKKIRSFGA